MIASALLRHHGPLLVHLLTGTAVVAYALRVFCGSDECLGPLYAGASAGVWAVAVPFVLVTSRAGTPGPRAIAWAVWLLCLPVSSAFALAVFLLQPALGGA